MAEKNRSTLKNFFKTGDKPTEAQFEDLIDSYVNRTDDSFVETVANASTTQKGIAERATTAEAQAGTDDTRFVTPKGVKNAINTFAPMEDTGWQPASLLNGFANYGANWQTARYRRKNGVVFLEGLVKFGSINAPILVLPPEFSPEKQLLFTTITNNTLGRINVFPNGEVKASLLQTQWISLSGITYLVD